jgi:hypothetical protein
MDDADRRWCQPIVMPSTQAWTSLGLIDDSGLIAEHRVGVAAQIALDVVPALSGDAPGLRATARRIRET